MGTVLGTVAALVLGAALGTATVVGVVKSQAADPAPKPVSTSVVDYGTN